MNITNARQYITLILKKIESFLIWLLRCLPLIGGLADCKVRDHKLAVKEFFLAFVFSTTTFWVTFALMSVLAMNSTTSATDLILKTVSNGELLLFSVSFAGPIFLVAMQERSGKTPFPGAIWHVVVLCAFAIVAASVSGVLKVQSVAPNVNLDLNMEGVRNLSYFIFAIAVVLRYTTIVYQKMLVNADAAGPKQDKAFADQWAVHVNNKG